MQPPPPVPAPPPAYPRPRRTVPLLIPHLGWEALLLVAVIVATTLLLASTEATVETVLRRVGVTGLLAAALALSLRTRTVNLAVAGIAAASGALYAELVAGSPDAAPLLGLVVVLAAMLPLGLLLGLVTGLTSAPAWAVSLGGLAATQAVVLGLAGPEGIAVSEHLPGPLSGDYTWFVVFLVLTLGGGALFAIPGIRRLAGPAGGDTPRFSGRKLVGALLGMGGSSVLAGLAGVAFVNDLGFFQPASFNVYQMLLVLGAVLLGGVSAFGGRGGIAGTALGVTLLSVLGIWLVVTDLDLAPRQAVQWGAIALAIVVGVIVSRLLEAIAPQHPDAAPAGPSPAPPSPLQPPPAPPPPGSPPPAPSAAAPPTASTAPPPEAPTRPVATQPDADGQGQTGTPQ